MEFRDIQLLGPQSFRNLMSLIPRIGKDQADIRLDARQNGTDRFQIRMVIARNQNMADLRIQTGFFADSDPSSPILTVTGSCMYLRMNGLS